MRIEAVVFKDLPPFADGFIRFPSQNVDQSGGRMGEIHLLTGQNGTGKTRLLCLLAGALGNAGPINSRIQSSKSSGATVLGTSKEIPRIFWRTGDKHCLGSDRLTPFSDDELGKMYVESRLPNAKPLQARSFLEIAGEIDPVAALAFRGIANVHDTKITALAPVNLGSVSNHLDFDRTDESVVCQGMANLKMLAAMDSLNPSASKPSRSFGLLQRLEGAISKITGRKFSFSVVPNPDVHLEVSWGSALAMTLKQLPDGLRSIIGWLVSCVAKLDAIFPTNIDPLRIPLILLLDEPESHLHPAWQRKILPAAQALFPQAQIFVATHSPFVISSVNKGWIHIFRASDDGTVTIEKPRECSAGDSYLDVIEDVLGVKEWYDPETESLLEEFRKSREAVLAGSGDFEAWEMQAQAIAKRSTSLHEMMARELNQARRILSLKAVATTAQ